MFRFARRERDASIGSNQKVAAPHDPDEAWPIATVIARATALAEDGRLGAGLALILAALTKNPCDRDLLYARASILFHWSRYRESRDALLALEKLGQAGAAFYLKLGWACFWAGDLPQSQRSMNKAVEADPNDWANHFGEGNALHAQRMYREAHTSFRRALDIRPDDPYCLANLLGCELALNNTEAAEALARRAIEVDPGSAVAWSNLGVVLDRLERYEEAIDAYERAEELSVAAKEPQYEFVNYAICLLRANRLRDGISFLESKLPRFPSVQAHCHYSLALLLSGRFEEGWEQYEFRWVDGPLRATRSNFPKPVWEGQDLLGKTLLLRSEQGYGDFIQFIRYAPYVKALGAKVVLQVPELVRKLAVGLSGIDHVLAADEAYPPFDFFVNMLSLPRIFGTNENSIPNAIPYLHARPELVEKWKRRVAQDSTLKVGLVWAGSPTHLRDKFRSLHLSALHVLGTVPNVTFYSLQKGPASSQVDDLPNGFKVVNLDKEIDDFVDTVAVISQLDLVICVDTSVAHLAGAMGKPTWMLLPNPADWRWLNEGKSSSWYPTIRLFRQTQVGMWSDVVNIIADELARYVSGDSKNAEGSVAGGVVTLSETAFVPRAYPLPPNNNLTAAAHTSLGTIQYLPSQDCVGPSLRFYGEHLQLQLNLLSRMVRPGSHVIEVGGGIGFHTLFLGKALGPSGHLVVYETRSVLQAILRQNLATNDVAAVTFMKKAVGIMGSDGDQEWRDGRDAKTRLVPQCETIDELQLDRLDWLKITEHEAPTAVVGGGLKTLWRLRPCLFVAVHDVDELLKLAGIVRECSYRTWRMDASLFNPDNFNRRENDIFEGRHAVALVAIPEEIDVDIHLDYCIEIN
jgi:tetratricopeptide (TPR) repeat protein